MITMIDKLKTMDFSLKTKETPYSYNGISVPRVTEILSSTIHEDFLMIWANSLGFRRIRYKDELARAANIGTLAHNSIENYLQHNKEPDTEVIPFLGFKMWWDIINKDNTVTILGEEETLTCPWFGGTYDLLLDINGKVYLVDFKTSNHISYKYHLQLAAYKYMIFINKGINIDGAIILQLDKNEIAFEEYLLDFSNEQHRQYFDHCLNTFFSLVYSYNCILYTREQYEEIFNKRR